MSSILQTLQVFWLNSSVFALEKSPKNLDCHSFSLPPKEGLVATFNGK